MTFEITQGSPQPYGSSFHKDSVNFALFSKNAHEVKLVLFSPTEKRILQTSPLYKTGDIWHGELLNFPKDCLYAYEVDQRLVSDPYARSVATQPVWGDGLEGYFPWAKLPQDQSFNWDDDSFPKTPTEELIIYEMHVRGFTIDQSSQAIHKGTFLGIIEKISYLKDLGVNAVELMPVHEFNEEEYLQHHPITQQRLYNYWGYSTVNFFAPMNRYGSEEDFKTMVKALHANEIEVILDVVFNHTAEGNEKGPLYSYKGIDPSVYYLMDENQEHLNFSGCGNTVNCNHPVVIEMILASLRYWVLEMHVDGFRFDLASVFYRNSKGLFTSLSPLIEAISHDPILANAKLIAEPWDAAGGYHVGAFFPEETRWSEWNDKYRDTVRGYIKGNKHLRKQFATRLCGSQDLYGQRSPTASINFIVSHDGFSLADLVSYNQKHNLANAENNRDGTSYNESWNCGAEGETDDPSILALRQRQMKNLSLALMTSQGIPMLLMGDEYGHTKAGNNNTWCQDNELNWFLWDRLEENKNFYRFYKKLVHFRKTHPILRRASFLNDADIQWHGEQPFHADWEQDSGFVAFTLIEPVKRSDIYVAFNAQDHEVVAHLPFPPENKTWKLVVDTAKMSPDDFSDHPEQVEREIKMLPFSALLLEAN